MNRFFAIDHQGSLSQDDAHHLLRVLRAKPGDHVELVVDETAYIATLTNIDPCQFELGDALPSNESKLDIHLFQGFCKGDKMDQIVQKAVELGANHIHPVLSRYSDIKLDDKRRRKKEAHFQGIAEAAAKQAKRNRIPKVHETKTIKEAIAYARDMEILFCYEAGEVALTPQQTNKSIAIFIGPEGGFHDDEVALIQEVGATPLSLGPRILRTETAGMVAITIVQYTIGDLK